jgi:hypothetical protein
MLAVGIVVVNKGERLETSLTDRPIVVPRTSTASVGTDQLVMCRYPTDPYASRSGGVTSGRWVGLIA